MENIKILLGKRIKEIRKHQKLTQEKLAELAGIETPSLCNIENGKNYPGNETLLKLSLALNVKPSELYNFEHERNSDDLKNEIQTLLKRANSDEIKLIYKIITGVMN